MTPEISLVDPTTLKPNPRNAQVYGQSDPPADLFESIERGWAPTSVLEALPDGTLLSGHLRRHVAIKLHLTEVPVVFRPDLTDDENAQVEELLRENAGRVKTREVVIREWRLAFETFKAETGFVAGEKSRDVVGKRFGVSGVTLQHGIGVLDALDGKAYLPEFRTKLRETLEQRGIEPAWKLLRQGPSGSTESPLGSDSEQDGSEQVSLAIQPAKRLRALQTSLTAIEGMEHLISDIEATVAAVPRADWDTYLARVQNLVTLLGNLEGELRDRLDAGRRPSRRRR